MTTPRSGIHAALRSAQSRDRTDSGAQPRPARVRFAISTSGIGESRLVGANAITFGAYMVEEPTFSYGCVAIDSLTTGQLPLATATVLNWQKTAQGLYAGAEVGFKVESNLYTIRLKFTLTFEGATMRTTVGTGADTLSAPRSTNTYQGSTTVDVSKL